MITLHYFNIKNNKYKHDVFSYNKNNMLFNLYNKYHNKEKEKIFFTESTDLFGTGDYRDIFMTILALF
jgi:hypothetical protein